MLSNYSPWDHYILPMMEDDYCSLLVIFWMSCLSSCCCRTTSKCLPIFCHYCEIQGPNPSTKCQGSCPANVQGRICSSLRPLPWCPQISTAHTKPQRCNSIHYMDGDRDRGGSGGFSVFAISVCSNYLLLSHNSSSHP